MEAALERAREDTDAAVQQAIKEASARQQAEQRAAAAEERAESEAVAKRAVKVAAAEVAEEATKLAFEKAELRSEFESVAAQEADARRVAEGTTKAEFERVVAAEKRVQQEIAARKAVEDAAGKAVGAAMEDTEIAMMNAAQEADARRVAESATKEALFRAAAAEKRVQQEIAARKAVEDAAGKAVGAAMEDTEIAMVNAAQDGDTAAHRALNKARADLDTAQQKAVEETKAREAAEDALERARLDTDAAVQMASREAATREEAVAAKKAAVAAKKEAVAARKAAEAKVQMTVGAAEEEAAALHEIAGECIERDQKILLLSQHAHRQICAFRMQQLALLVIRWRASTVDAATDVRVTRVLEASQRDRLLLQDEQNAVLRRNNFTLLKMYETVDGLRLQKGQLAVTSCVLQWARQALHPSGGALREHSNQDAGGLMLLNSLVLRWLALKMSRLVTQWSQNSVLEGQLLHICAVQERLVASLTHSVEGLHGRSDSNQKQLHGLNQQQKLLYGQMSAAESEVNQMAAAYSQLQQHVNLVKQRAALSALGMVLKHAANTVAAHSIANWQRRAQRGMTEIEVLALLSESGALNEYVS